LFSIKVVTAIESPFDNFVKVGMNTMLLGATSTSGAGINMWVCEVVRSAIIYIYFLGAESFFRA
jgi:hypothetical protein